MATLQLYYVNVKIKLEICGKFLRNKSCTVNQILEEMTTEKDIYGKLESGVINTVSPKDYVWKAKNNVMLHIITDFQKRKLASPM